MGSNTLGADAAGIGYTDGSCCEDKIEHGALPARVAEGEIKERRGGGVRYEGRGVRVETRPDAGKRRNARCAKTASTARYRGHAKTGC